MSDDRIPMVRTLAPRASARRISRRGFLAGMGVVAAGVVAGCSADRRIAPSAPLGDTIEGRLNYYSWGDYENPDDLDKIKAQYGFKLQVDSYGSNEELVAKLAAARGTSGYDVVVPTGVYIPQMVAHGLLIELDHSRIPNLKNLEPRFYNPVWNPNSRYGACKDWGTTGFMYDKSIVKGAAPTSWGDFIELAQGPARGKTSVLEDPWEVLSIALGSLGINPNTVDPAQLEAGRAVLLDKLAPTIRGYNSSITTVVAGGGFTLLQAWNGDARLALSNEKDPDRWGFVYPTPTANLWTDNFCIAAGTQHPAAAHAFINAMLDPEISYSEMDYIGYQTGVAGLGEKARAADVDYPDLLFPPDEVVARLVPSTVDDMTERRTAIINEMQARSAQA